MEELLLSCMISEEDELYVTVDTAGLIAFETTGDSVVVLSDEAVRKLVTWLQERLDK
ncbi:hypothetical protein UFOVP568_22 [uncultured Caudovirales phage]|uniref:Uncharacterized protein n=1 Tax=uncultured Caudovirales phage TaxID=2100421 RepID=A0A6J5MWW1_9CAUD|nr:hypothetical protein UFOVP568_22 [uncultured Caudovirales phage]